MEGNVGRDKKGRFRKRTAEPKQEIIDYNNNEIIDENNPTKFPGKTIVNECSEAHNDEDGPPRNSNDSHTFSNAFEGRRIVELSVLAENLRKGCFVCHTHLQLSDCVGERLLWPC